MTRYERRDRKRKQREKSKRMRGNRRIFDMVRSIMKRSKPVKIMTLKVDTDDWR